MPQAADAVAVLAGKLVLLTLPGGCGHSAVRLLQAGERGLVGQSSSGAALGSRGAGCPLPGAGGLLDKPREEVEGQEPKTTGWGLVFFLFIYLFLIYLIGG